jgi:hypothetical protein
VGCWWRRPRSRTNSRRWCGRRGAPRWVMGRCSRQAFGPTKASSLATAATGDRDVLPRHRPPGDAERVEVVAEDVADVGGVVRECVAGIRVLLAGAPDAVDRPAAVRVDQPAQHQLGRAVADRTLPVRQRNAAGVLPSRPVLRDEARPMLRVGVDFDAGSVASKLHRRLARWHDLGHGVAAGGDDQRIPHVEGDAKTVDAACVARDAAVAQVQAQQIGVGRREQAEVVRVRRGPTGGPPSLRAFESGMSPVANGASWDSRPPRDLAVVQPRCEERLDLGQLCGRPHATAFTRPRPPSCGGWDSNPHVLADNAF